MFIGTITRFISFGKIGATDGSSYSRKEKLKFAEDSL